MDNNLSRVAQEYFLKGDFSSAKKIYSDLNCSLELAYCEIYLGNLNKAKEIILHLKKDSPIEEWIESFVQMIELNLQKKPSFLQIRNFFEIDLSNLFLSGQKEYAENVINLVPTLVNINPEIFKLAARVLKDNNQDNLALKFLNESLNICFVDAETHFLMAELCLKYDEKEKARKHLTYACESGNYFPAKKLLAKIEEY